MNGMKLSLTLGLTILILAVLSAITYGATRTTIDINPVSSIAVVADPDPVDFGPEFRNTELQLDLSNIASFSGMECGDDYDVGDSVVAFGFDWFYGILYLKTYTVKAIGTYGEVWVADDPNWGILPEWDPNRPPWTDSRTCPVITDDQINYLLDEFDNNIYLKDTEFFGIPDNLDGSNAILDDILGNPNDYYCNPDKKDRVIILVDNVRDDNYYDPTFPVYIAGGYHGAYDYYMDRNVITIDAYAWEKRMGPPGPGIERPYMYEGVIAHEFQHLIHYDIDPFEVVFVQEGCSDLAYWLCGYGHPGSHIEGITDHPENSLTVWGDQGLVEITADYGIVYLWTLYLYEHFGGAPFIKAMVANPGIGIEGISAVLNDFGYCVDFDDVFHNYRIALLIDSPQPFRLPYMSNKMHSFCDLWKLPHPYEIENIDIHINIATEEARGPTFELPCGALMNHAPPWGTDYIEVRDAGILTLLKFDGSDILPTPWLSDGSALWSGAGDLLDNFMIAEVDLTGSTDSVLTFDTWYDIEFAYDYGFVQVSTDGGLTWTSLSNPHTTNVIAPDAHPNVVANLPGFTGTSGGGLSPVWVGESFDLSAYDDQVILLAFRYVTDWAGVWPGWYMDNIAVNGSILSDGSSAEGFTGSIDNDFSVTLVGINERCGKTRYQVMDVCIRDLDEVGYSFLNGVIRRGGYGAILVSFEAPLGASMYAQYEYSLFNLFNWH
ncbi:MAG: peptidase M6 [bacterium]